MADPTIYGALQVQGLTLEKLARYVADLVVGHHHDGVDSRVAALAALLSPGKTINGVLFDGSGNIVVPAAAGTLTGTTLASGVTIASLASILNSLVVDGNLRAYAGGSGAARRGALIHSIQQGGTTTSTTNVDLHTATLDANTLSVGAHTIRLTYHLTFNGAGSMAWTLAFGGANISVHTITPGAGNLVVVEAWITRAGANWQYASVKWDGAVASGTERSLPAQTDTAGITIHFGAAASGGNTTTCTLAMVEILCGDDG